MTEPLSLETGIRLRREGKIVEALPHFEAAYKAQPYSARIWHELSMLMLAGKDYERAKAVLLNVHGMVPYEPQPCYQLGLLADQAGEYEQAERWLRLAILNHRRVKKPGVALVWGVLGGTLYRLGKRAGGDAAYDKALVLSDDSPAGRFAKSQILLAREQWAEGWKLYESRWELPEMWRAQAGHGTDRANLPPMWDGKSRGRVLCVAEQGSGDTVFAARYFMAVAERSGYPVNVQCQPELVTLMQLMPGVGYVIPNGELPPVYADWHIPLLSLPHVIGGPPITSPEPTERAQWLRTWPLRVGVCWRGSPDHANDKDRSCPDSLLPTIGAIPNVDAISLQHGPEGRYFRDFLDTAELLQTLDAVVTVDTSVVHLAGTLGVPTYLIPPTVPDWRWPASQGERTCWYDSVRVIRRKTSRDWSPAVQQVVQHITRLAEET